MNPQKMFVSTINADRGFAHVEDPQAGERLMLHQADANFLLSDLRRGDAVIVGRVAMTAKGLRAYEATFGERPAGEVMTALVTSVQTARGFCHACTEDGRSVFCHTRSFVDYRSAHSDTFHQLVPGMRLRLSVRDAYPCPIGTQVEVIHEEIQ